MVLSVSDKDKTAGIEQQITIRTSGGLLEEEIEKMIKEAELLAQRDQERESLIFFFFCKWSPSLISRITQTPLFTVSGKA